MYTFEVEVNKGFDDTITAVTEALKTEGFGVLTDIDFKATIKAKLDIDVKPYRILGACNPPLANQAVSADPNAGALLPCNVVVRENEAGSCTVAFMDPMAVLKLSDSDGLADIASEANDRLQRVRQALS